MSKKIKAFTILEMIVVMAISTLVIIIGLTVFIILQNQFTNFQKSSDSINKYYFFFRTIEGDLEQAFAVYDSKNAFIITKGKRKITYFFDNHQITREERFVIDTIINDVPQIRMEFNDLIQNEMELLLIFYLEEDTLKYALKYKTQTLNAQD